MHVSRLLAFFFIGISNNLLADSGLSSWSRTATSSARAELIMREIDKNPAMPEKIFRTKVRKEGVENNRGLKHYYRNAHLAATNPLEIDDLVLLDQKYVGHVRYVFPGGRKVSVELEGYPDELYTYERIRLAKAVETINEFVVGERVTTPGNFYGVYEGKIISLFDDGYAAVEYDGYEGEKFLEATSDLAVSE